MLTRIKTSEVLPVSLTEVKAHLRLDHAHEDEYLCFLIQASTGFIEQYLGRSLLAQSWRLTWQIEETQTTQLSLNQKDICFVSLPYPPLRRIISVYRLLSTGEKKSLKRHRLEVNHQIPKLVFAQSLETIEIEFETGYGDYPKDIPSVIRQAILMNVADFYENRGPRSDPQSLSAHSLMYDILETYRVTRLS